MNFLDGNYKLTNNLDEKFNMLKCMDGTNSKIFMSNENRIYKDENHIYMDENDKKMKYLDDDWKLTNCLDETYSWLSVWMKVIPK